MTVLILVAFGLRVGYCVAKGTLGRSPQRGYREYVMAGQRLLEHRTLVSPLIVADVDRTPSAEFPPAYAGLVAVAYALLGVESSAATALLQVVNAAAGALTVLVVFLIAWSIGGRRAAWVAGAIATVNPTLVGFTDMIWDTSLFTLGVAVSAWMAQRLSARPVALRSWLGMGLWLGALALLNPALTVAYPFLVLWPLGRSSRWHGRSVRRGAGMTVLGWLIAITPWTVRNYVHFGELVYIRYGFPLDLWLGVCPEADSQGGDVYVHQFPLNNDDVQREIAAIGERAFLRDRGDRARAAVAADPWRFAKLCAIRAVDYWTGSIFTHTTSDAGLAPRSAWRAGVMYFLMAEGAVVLFVLLIDHGLGRDLPWLLAIVASFSIVYCLTHIQVRFRAPTEPLMAIIVGLLTVQASARVTRRFDREFGRGSRHLDRRTVKRP